MGSDADEEVMLVRVLIDCFKKLGWRLFETREIRV